MPDYTSYRSTAYDALEDKYAKQYGIPVEMLRSVRLNGERSNANQVSPIGARTVYQFSPETRAAWQKKHGFDPWANPDNATRAAAMHLAGDWTRSKGNARETIASYIAGPSGRGRGPVTRDYVGRVTRGMDALRGSQPSATSPSQVSGAVPVEDDETVAGGEGTATVSSTPALGGGLKGGDLSAYMDKQRQSLSDLYDQAAARMRERYRAPSQNDMWLSLGAALLKPTENGKFTESLANVPEALMGYNALKRKYEDSLAEGQTSMDLAKANALAGLEEKYITAATKSPRTAIDPTSGTVLNLDTAEPVIPASVLKVVPGDPQSIAAFNALPKGAQFYDVETRQMRRK